eukprot:g2045.t1
MCDSEIGPVGATALAAAIKVHPALTHLSLKHNPILAEGAEAIFRATRRNGVCGLAELDLYDCGIGPEGATMLAAQLYKNKTLEDLRLRYNQMGPEGATAIASMLMENRTIIDLDMVLNSVQMAGALAFERVLKNTVIVEVDKGDDISKLKDILAVAKKKITDPFWDDLKAPASEMDSNVETNRGSSEDQGSDRRHEGDTEVGESKREGSPEAKDVSAGDLIDEQDLKKGADDSTTKDAEDSGGEESKAKSVKKPKKLSRRAQKKADAEAAARERKRRANLRFWMRSTIYTIDEVNADYHAQFMSDTKRRSCSLVLFAGTNTQCARAVEFLDNDTWHVGINSKNNTVKEINLGQNNFERDFRRQPEQMKRLLGSTVKGLWQDVADFFRPTIMNF